MTESCMITLLCPVCGNPLIKTRYETKGRWVTSCRIHCANSACNVDTGKQCHMSAAYESLAVMYYGAMSNCVYEKGDTDDKP